MSTAVRTEASTQVKARITDISVLIPRKYTPLAVVAQMLQSHRLIRPAKHSKALPVGVAFRAA